MQNYPKGPYQQRGDYNRDETYEQKQERLKRQYGSRYDPDYAAKKRGGYQGSGGNSRGYSHTGNEDRSRSLEAAEWNDRGTSRAGNHPPAIPSRRYESSRSSSSTFDHQPSTSENRRPDLMDNRRPDLIDPRRTYPSIDTRNDYRTQIDRSVPTSPLTSGARTPLVTPTATSATSASTLMPAPAPLAKQITTEGTQLAAELKKIMMAMKQTVRLEDKRERAQKDLAQVSSNLTKFQKCENQFPAALYTARQEYEEVKAELDARDKALKKAESEFSLAGLVHCIENLVRSSSSIPSATMSSIQEDLEKTREDVQFLRQSVHKAEQASRITQGSISKLQTQTETVHSIAKTNKQDQDRINQILIGSTTSHTEDINKLKSDCSGFAKANDTLEASVKDVKAELSTVTAKQQQQVSKMQELEAQSKKSSKADNGNFNSEAFAELESRTLKLEGAEQSLRGLYETVQQKIDKTSAIDPSEIKTLKSEIDTINATLVKHKVCISTMETNLQGFDADLKEVYDRTAERASSNQQSNPTSTQTTDNALSLVNAVKPGPTLTTKQEALRKELKVSPAVFQALGDIPARMSALFGIRDALVEQQGAAFDELQGEFKNDLEGVRGSLRQEISQISDKLLDMESKVKGVEVDQKRDNTLLQSVHKKVTDMNALTATLLNQTNNFEKKLSAFQNQIAAVKIPGASTPVTSQPNGFNNNRAVSDQMPKTLTQEDKKFLAEMDHRYQSQFANVNRRMDLVTTDVLGQGILGSFQSAFPDLPNIQHKLLLLEQSREEADFCLTDQQKKVAEIQEAFAKFKKEVQDLASLKASSNEGTTNKHTDDETVMNLTRKLNEFNDALNNQAIELTALRNSRVGILPSLKKVDEALVTTRKGLKALEERVAVTEASPNPVPNAGDAAKPMSPAPGVQRQLGDLAAQIMDVRTAQVKLNKEVSALKKVPEECKALKDKYTGLVAHIEALAEDHKEHGESVNTLGNFIRSVERDMNALADRISKSHKADNDDVGSVGTKRSAEGSPPGEDSGRKKKKFKTSKSNAGSSSRINNADEDPEDGEYVASPSLS